MGITDFLSWLMGGGFLLAASWILERFPKYTALRRTLRRTPSPWRATPGCWSCAAEEDEEAGHEPAALSAGRGAQQHLLRRRRGRLRLRRGPRPLPLVLLLRRGLARGRAREEVADG